MVSLLRMPPQRAHGGSASPARTRSSASRISPFHPQDRQTTAWTVPWTSITRAGEFPAFWCRPSMFWVMRACSLPRRSRATIAAWPAFGSAFHAGWCSRDCQDFRRISGSATRSEEHTSELQSHSDLHSFPTRRSSDLLESDDRRVARVRERVPRRMVQPRLPGFPPDLGIGDVIADVRELLRFRVSGPHALGPAKIRYARFGGDPRAGEEDDALRLPHPGADPLDQERARAEDSRVLACGSSSGATW